MLLTVTRTPSTQVWSSVCHGTASQYRHGHMMVSNNRSADNMFTLCSSKVQQSGGEKCTFTFTGLVVTGAASVKGEPSNTFVKMQRVFNLTCGSIFFFLVWRNEKGELRTDCQKTIWPTLLDWNYYTATALFSQIVMFRVKSAFVKYCLTNADFTFFPQ